jgi:hypothetical protein
MYAQKYMEHGKQTRTEEGYRAFQKAKGFGCPELLSYPPTFLF